MIVEPLSEHKCVRQRPNEGYRRWYVNSYFDVILWYDTSDGDLIGFQFCYSRNKGERVFTWTHEYQSSHLVSDSRPERGMPGLATAILKGDGGPIPLAVIERFDQEALELPSDVRLRIIKKLNEYNLR